MHRPAASPATPPATGAVPSSNACVQPSPVMMPLISDLTGIQFVIEASGPSLVRGLSLLCANAEEDGSVRVQLSLTLAQAHKPGRVYAIAATAGDRRVETVPLFIKHPEAVSH